MHRFIRNLLTEWRRMQLPVANATVVVGVSGGADSVSLLLGIDELRRLDKLALRVVAAHFNHGLRGAESDADEEFVRSLTTEREIEFAAGRDKVSSAGNLEQNARSARYNFLRETAWNVDAYAILTGHTLNDQAETFLMNLVRGSGPDGLCGMKPIRPLQDETSPAVTDGCEPSQIPADSHGPLLFPTGPLLARPLLSWAKRGDTEGFCSHLGIDYRYDSMNEDTAFRRVQIRRILIPLLEDMNPNIIETLARTASLMQEINEPRRNRSAPPGELTLAGLRAMSKAELYDTIRHWLANKRGTARQLQLKHIEGVERLLSSKRSGRVAEIPGGRVIKRSGRLVYEHNKVENSPSAI